MFVDEVLDVDICALGRVIWAIKEQCTHKCLSHAHATPRRGGEINDRRAFRHCKFTNSMNGVVSILWEYECGPWSEGEGFADKLECSASVRGEDDC